MVGYVLQGVGYFLTHPSLWCMSLCPLLLTLAVAITSVVVVFAAALYPQADGLTDAGVPAPLVWILSLLLVIIEIFLITLIYSLVILPCYMDKVFEKVLIDKGFGDLVVNEDQHAGCLRVCAAICRVSVWLRILVLILSLPLNLIPIIGTILYLWLNGVILAWEYHLYYFELKGYRYAEQKAIVDERRAEYSAFGMPALFLEMIPGVGPLFLFTNTVGAALMAVDMETELRQNGGGVDPTSHYNDPATATASVAASTKAAAATQVGNVSPTTQGKQVGGYQIV